MSSSTALHISLLRPPVLHILRAVGFNGAKPAAVDALVDLAARYLNLLATRTAEHAWLNHNDSIPNLTDVRMSLQDVGALQPGLGALEEQLGYDDDLRGMENFINWITGDANKEIRRIAGLEGSDTDVLDVNGGLEREDFLTALKKKHSKTGEESKFQGTVLGKPAAERIIKIEGGAMDTIQSWESNLRQSIRPSVAPSGQLSSVVMSSGVSSPLSDI